jgi:hypothetical protein
MTNERGLPTETASEDFSYIICCQLVMMIIMMRKLEKRKMVAVQGLEPRTQGL